MADEQKEVLTPVEQKTILFYDDELTAVKLENDEVDEIYVPVRRLCDNLGLTWSSQYMRIQRDEVLSDAIKTVLVMRTVKEGGRGGGAVETICLRLDMIPGWLFGIQTGRVKEEIRDKLIRYRREAFQVLWNAFKHDVLAQVEPELVHTSSEMTPAERALALAEAVAEMARQQVTIERWLSQHDSRLATVEDTAISAHDLAEIAHARLDKAAEVVGKTSQRLRRIELTIAGGATVTDAQAAAISEAVKALAFELGKKEPDRGNPYQRVYSELYRKFHVPSYKALPLESFPAVMRWLTEWWQQLTPKEAPFAAGDVGGQQELPTGN